MTLTFIRFLIACTIPLSAICGATADIIKPVTGMWEDLQAAANQAQLGDTILIPPGRWALPNNVVFPTGIHVRGMGKDLTVIVNANPATSTEMFRIDAVAGRQFTMSDLTLEGRGRALVAQGDTSVRDKGLFLRGRHIGFRIHHCRFTGFSNAGIQIFAEQSDYKGHPEGVIDHNEFIENFYLVPDVMALGYGVAIYGDVNDWSLHLGTGSAVFVEDNIFILCRHSIAANSAARYVFRYNTITNNYYPFAAVDAHGRGISARGTRSYEIYENQISGGIDYRTDEPQATWALGLRGADGVVFNNRFTEMAKPIYLAIEGGINDKTYPVPDQVRDLWLWGNRLDGNLLNTLNAGVHNNETNFFHEGRDYYFAEKSGYRPYIYPHPLTEKKVVYPYSPDDDTLFLYHFDEAVGSATTIDSSTNSWTLTQQTVSPFNGVSGPANLSGAVGTFTNHASVLRRDLSMNEIVMVSVTNFTIEVWCRNPKLELLYDTDGLFQFKPLDGSKERLQFGVRDGKFDTNPLGVGRFELAYYRLSDNGYEVVRQGPYIVWDVDVWYHCAVTYDSSTAAPDDSIVKFYRTKFGDRKAVLLQTFTGCKDVKPLTVVASLRVGDVDGWADRYWGGDIDEFRFTNRTMDPSEFNLAICAPTGAVINVR